MEWLANTEDASQSAATISKAYEVIRQNPPKAQTKRLGKLAQRKAKGLSEYDELDSEDESNKQRGTISGELATLCCHAP